MGYNIEVSFDITKNSSVTQLHDTIRNVAKECECETFYEDYEYDSHVQFKRNHCVMTAIFSQTNIDELLHFLHFIKKTEGLFLELVYDDIANVIVFDLCLCFSDLCFGELRFGELRFGDFCFLYTLYVLCVFLCLCRLLGVNV